MKGISILGAAFLLCSQSVTQADDTSDVIFRQGFEPSQLPNVTGPDVDLETVLPAYSTGLLSFSATATDEGSGVKQVEFYCDGSYLFATVLTGSPYTTSFNSDGVIDGDHSFHVKAYDYDGNVSSSNSGGRSKFCVNVIPAYS
jgi:hypothetical protein